VESCKFSPHDDRVLKRAGGSLDADRLLQPSSQRRKLGGVPRRDTASFTPTLLPKARLLIVTSERTLIVYG
jgi:hypothetical protein